MKPRSKTSRKPLKKKQNGKRTTKKHKQTHQARRKKSRGMIGGVRGEGTSAVADKDIRYFRRHPSSNENEPPPHNLAENKPVDNLSVQDLAEDFHKIPPKKYLFVGYAALSLFFVGYALFGNDLN